MSAYRPGRTVFYLLLLCAMLMLVCFGLLETPLIAEVFSR